MRKGRIGQFLLLSSMLQPLFLGKNRNPFLTLKRKKRK